MTNHNSSASQDKNKDVIYVDVEDDITGMIERMQASRHRIVALVLPKRFATLQSIVNMKLLKRASERTKKHIVLITSEASLLPLAGSAGIHVAKTLQSKPEVPDAPLGIEDKEPDAAEEATAAAVAAEPDAIDKTKTLKQLAGDEDEAPIELDNADMPAEAAAAKPEAKQKKNKKLKVPNFNKFRTLLIFGGIAVVVLIGFAIWAFMVLPKADIRITTDSTAVTSSREVTLTVSDTATLNADDGTLPAKRAEAARTQRKEVAATGETNKGEKASGDAVMTAKNCSTTDTPKSVPAGTGISTDGKTYVTKQKADFTFDSFNDGCLMFESNEVAIGAQNAGESFNVKSATFTVAGRSDVGAQGSAKGGTDKIVKVVTQEDIDKAKEQIQSQDSDEVKKELREKLQDQGLFAVEATFATNSSNSDMSAKPGDEADNVTVTEEVTYTMLGVSTQDLEKVIVAGVADKIDAQRQTILSYGLDEATFRLQNQQGDEALVGIHSVVVAGPDLDVDAIKQAVAGLKGGDAKPIIEEYPGVTGVDISYGPFWVRAIPGNTSKINVVIEEPEPAEENTETQDNAQTE